MEIEKIESNGRMHIEFSETLNSFEDFERFGMNSTFWRAIQNEILKVTYICN